MRPGVGETGVDVRVRQQAAADRRPLVGAAGDPAQLLVVGGEQVDQRGGRVAAAGGGDLRNASPDLIGFRRGDDPHARRITVEGTQFASLPVGAEARPERVARPQRPSGRGGGAAVQLDASGELFEQRRDRSVGVDREWLGQRLEAQVAAEQPVNHEGDQREQPPQLRVVGHVERREHCRPQRWPEEAGRHGQDQQKGEPVLRIRRDLEDGVAFATEVGEHAVFARHRHNATAPSVRRRRR
jgi:hypothetical protein